MIFNMVILGLKEVILHKIEEYQNRLAMHVTLSIKEQVCPSCGVKMIQVRDYRVQKVKHLKWFERLPILFYKRLRYDYACGM